MPCIENKCEICKSDTEVIFNIGFTPVSVCESCATSIFLQQAVYYSKQEKSEI